MIDTNYDDIPPPLTFFSPGDRNFDRLRFASIAVARRLCYSKDRDLKDIGARILHCASYLRFSQCSDGKIHLSNSNFCRCRLCPICQWRRALKYRARFFQKIPQMLAYTDNWHLLTLTVRNPPVQRLDLALDRMHSAFSSIFRADRIYSKLGATPAWIRSLEISCPENPHYAHPHYHVLLGMPSGYYIPQKKWISLWRAALQVPYFPSVRISKVKPLNEKSLCEVFKYINKPSDLLKSRKWLENYAFHIKNRRVIDYSSFFRSYKSSSSDDDLIHIDDRASDADPIPGLPELNFSFYQAYRRYLLDV